MSVSLIGGKGENILTSLEAGGGMAGATSEARSIGGRAGSENLDVESSFDSAGGCGGGVLLVRPGGGDSGCGSCEEGAFGFDGNGCPKLVKWCWWNGGGVGCRAKVATGAWRCVRGTGSVHARAGGACLKEGW